MFNSVYYMPRVDGISFNRHLPNCVCGKCNKERDRNRIGRRNTGMAVNYDDINKGFT